MKRALAVLAGLVLAVLVVVLGGRPRPRPRPAPMVSAPLVADDVGALAEVLVHYTPDAEAQIEPAYRDFLGTLPAGTRTVVVHPASAGASTRAFLDRIGAHDTRLVPVTARLAIWSKDRALVLDGTEARTTLLVPPKPRSGESGRPFDWNIVPAVVAAMPDHLAYREIPIAFDAGDFAIAGDRVLYDVNLWERNRGRGYATPVAFRERLRNVLGREVMMLGVEDAGVPQHHMSMYMASLGGNEVLVGDPVAGARLVGKDYRPGEKSPERGDALVSDTSPATLARFERAASDLTRLGFHVTRIPTVAFDAKTYFAYTNGVFETRAGKKHVWMPVFDVPALDEAARGVYEGQGFVVHPVHVRSLYAHHGTIGCVVNVLARTRPTS